MKPFCKSCMHNSFRKIHQNVGNLCLPITNVCYFPKDFSIPRDTGRELNLLKTFRGCLGTSYERSIYVLCPVIMKK